VTPEALLDFAMTAMTLGLSMLAGALLLAPPRTRAASWLAAYFACLAIDSSVGLAIGGASVTPDALRWLHVVNVPVAWLYGPLLYGYVRSLTVPAVEPHPQHALVHLVPYAATLAFSLANALGALDVTRAGRIAFLISYHAWVISGLFYLAFAIRQIHRSRPAREESEADEALLDLAWLRRLVALIAVLWIVMTSGRFPSADAANGFVVLLDVLFVASLYLLAWFGLREQRARPARIEAPSASPPYARSGLAADQCASVAAELSRLMVDEALYADSAFDLAALSRRSGWPPNHVSQALNQGLGRNFFEFVNGFRIAAAERHLADPDDRRTILEIALACGFGSKSTFNAVFKRMTGRTPREFRRASESLREKPAV
jgi:AraC-like DNA-binding protein